MSRSNVYYQGQPNASVSTTMTYPAGWQPPFQGPPPIPAGANINPQLWNTGQWVFNPAYQHRPPPTANQAAWMASQHWAMYAAHPGQVAAQQAQAQGQSHNPYKRTIRAPSAEYLAQKLVDNPLGLTDMIPREELYETTNGENHTPWIWNPRMLADNNDEQGIITADYRDASGRRIAQESRGLAPSRQGSIGRKDSNGSESVHQRSSSSAAAIRHSTDPSSSGPVSGSGHHRLESTSAPIRHSSEPPPQIYASASTSSTHERTPSRRGSSQEPPSQSQRLREDYPRRNSEASLPQPPSRSQSVMMESFTSHKELKPTFPTSIVRTPEHYSHPPTRSTSTPIYSNSQATSTGFAQAAQLAAQIERITLGGSSSRPGAELSRHTSLPSSAFSSSSSHNHNSMSHSSASSSISDVRNLSEEPAAMLSPLMLGTTPKPSSRSLGRGHSASSIPSGSGSSSLSSIPETSSPLNPNNYNYTSNSGRNSASNSTTHSPNQQSPSRRESSRSRRTSPAVTPAITPPQRSPSDSHFSYQGHPSSSSYHTQHPTTSTSHRSPSRHAYPSQSQSQSHSQGHSPNQGPSPNHSQTHISQSSRPHNPLPPPPVEIRYPLPAASKRKSPPTTYTRRVRKGYWNKRGDHLTADGYIVFVPHHLVYPDELKDYPEENEGYRDQWGGFVKHSNNRRELPESLPWHGEPPERPYESFIVYDYQ